MNLPLELYFVLNSISALSGEFAHALTSHLGSHGNHGEVHVLMCAQAPCHIQQQQDDPVEPILFDFSSYVFL